MVAARCHCGLESEPPRALLGAMWLSNCVPRWWKRKSRRFGRRQCGRLSELTFFGRAVFDEQLRRTHSFEQAFAAAVPLIRQREIDAGKDDGFSNPQMAVGAQIGPVLKALEARLGK